MGRRRYILLRRRHDVQIRCRGDIPQRRLGNVPRRRRWVFHLRCNCDVAETYRETSLRRRYDVLLPDGAAWYMTIYVASEIPWNRILYLDFAETKSYQYFSILTETHINHDQIHHIINNRLVSNVFCLRDSHTKGCLSWFIWHLKTDTDPTGRFMSFKFTPSNDRFLCVYVPSGYSTTREQLNKGAFLWRTTELYGKSK